MLTVIVNVSPSSIVVADGVVVNVGTALVTCIVGAVVSAVPVVLPDRTVRVKSSVPSDVKSPEITL